MDKKVLLIADDEEMNRRIIRKFLKDSYEVIEAEDGEAALEVLNSRPVDVLLLDIIMPKMDGLEVLRQMREQPKLDHVGVLVATSTKEKTERSALSIGADDVVSKPYDPLVIKKRLENILAVKEVNNQKELLQNKEYEELLRAREKSIITQLEEQLTHASEQLVKKADIIQANIENTELVTEVVKDIRRQAVDLTTLVANQE